MNRTLGGGAVQEVTGSAEFDEVNSGAILVADTVTVNRVTSGAIVIADTVRGLETVSSGGTVVSEDVRGDPRAEAGGRIHKHMERLILDVKNDIRRKEERDSPELFIESDRERLETIKSLER